MVKMKLQISYAIESHNLLSSFQYGFRKLGSTMWAMLKVTEDIRTSLDSNKIIVHT